MLQVPAANQRKSAGCIRILIQESIWTDGSRRGMIFSLTDYTSAMHDFHVEADSTATCQSSQSILRQAVIMAPILYLLLHEEQRHPALGAWQALHAGGKLCSPGMSSLVVPEVIPESCSMLPAQQTHFNNSLNHTGACITAVYMPSPLQQIMKTPSIMVILAASKVHLKSMLKLHKHLVRDDLQGHLICMLPMPRVLRVLKNSA